MGMDGFTVISSCFCALTVAVTFALVFQIHFGSPQINPHGAVATDDQICSEIGVNTLKDGGNAVDALVASLICLSVTHPHLVGAGGSGVALIHDHKLNKTKIFDFMTGVPTNMKHPTEKLRGDDGRGIGVPGFLKGLEKMHGQYGTFTWSDLFKPAITLANHGFTVSKHLSDDLKRFIHAKHPQAFKEAHAGTALKREKYAKFLEAVATNGSKEFYMVTSHNEVLEALKKAGSKVSIRDFHSYEVKERPFIQMNVQNLTVLTAGPPFGGPQVLSGLSLIDQADFTSIPTDNELFDSLSKALLYGSSTVMNLYDSGIGDVNVSSSTFVEDLEYSENVQFGNIGAVIPEYPSSQVSIIDTQDLYATAVVGLGSSFGSGIITEQEIVLNNHLSQLPPHEDHQETTEEFTRPYSSYVPLMVMDSQNVCGKRLVLSSGSTGAMLHVVSNLIYKKVQMIPAISAPRITLGKQPNILLIDDFVEKVKKLPTGVRKFLQSKNFTFQGLFEPLGVNGVSKIGDSLVSHSDIRTGGIAARVHGHDDL